METKIIYYVRFRHNTPRDFPIDTNSVFVSFTRSRSHVRRCSKPADKVLAKIFRIFLAYAQVMDLRIFVLYGRLKKQKARSANFDEAGSFFITLCAVCVASSVHSASQTRTSGPTTLTFKVTSNGRLSIRD